MRITIAELFRLAELVKTHAPNSGDLHQRLLDFANKEKESGGNSQNEFGGAVEIRGGCAYSDPYYDEFGKLRVRT